ncbi:MAG TPA: rhodanese-like domain-containing protein [Hyphomicrobiales bacterium]|nr:rhodanese-like domain-containing protein [Hyphomicrobiales bacterium]
MPKAMKIGYDALVRAAKRNISEIEPEAVLNDISNDKYTFIDVRDIREVKKTGRIPGSFHCPRGMLEFWIDPASPYYKPIFGEARHFVFYCWLDWRSALSASTAQTMGLENVAHIKGGFKAWIDSGGPVEMLE